MKAPLVEKFSLKPLGIFGGTFNPVHLGHIRAATAVRLHFDLAEVRLIPCHIPVHRSEPGVSSAHRLSMLNCAVEDIEGVEVDPREIHRQGLSYTVDTLDSLTAEFPGREIRLIVGSDAFAGFTDWYQWQRILNLCSLIVMLRPGNELPEKIYKQISTYTCRVFKKTEHQKTTHSSPEQSIKEPGLLNGCGKILTIDSDDYLNVSSTEVRHLISAGEKIDHLLPPCVIDYIKENSLYGLN